MNQKHCIQTIIIQYFYIRLQTYIIVIKKLSKIFFNNIFSQNLSSMHLNGLANMSEKVKKLCIPLQEFAVNYAKRLHEGGGQLNIAKVSGQIYTFFSSKPTVQQKIQFNIAIRECFRQYLIGKYGKQIERTVKSQDSDVFIDTIAIFWQNYQRFTFGIDLITNKGDTFYRTFNNGVKYRQMTNGQKDQVATVPVIAVNELSNFMKRLNVINRYSQIFCRAIANEREDKAVQSQKIRDTMQFFQASCYDFDAVIRKGVDNKPTIRKQTNNQTKAALSRHSTAQQFFEKYMMKDLLLKCQIFYKKFVTYEALTKSATDEISMMLNFLNNEQNRGQHYIHEQKNYKRYMKCVNENLILFRMEERIKKATGFIYYLEHYQINKNDYRDEIQKFWKVYHRVFIECKDYICQIYNQYFEQEAQNMLELMEKGLEFINAAVILNKKNKEIVNMLGNMLDFDRIRVESLEKILSCEMIKGNKYQGKYVIGAKHLSVALNQKIRGKYPKDQKYGEDEADLMGLFKIFKYKTVAIKEHSKFLNTRLLEQLDISKDAQYMNAIQLQQRVIEQIKKQSSENDVKNPQQCLKDIGKSQQITNKIKSMQIGKKYHFLNQIIIKNNTFWNQSTFFDIQPPQILRKCIVDVTNQIQKNANIQFQLFNGVSTLRYSSGPNKFNFQIKNIYIVILLMLDQRPNKRLFYSEIRDRVKPSGRLIDKAYLELSKYLIQLTHFGLLKSNKSLKPGTLDIQKCQGSDYFEINTSFNYPKKLAVYKTNLLTILPQHIKKPFAIKMKLLDQEERQYEKDRKLYVQSHCVKLLKHAHHNGGSTVTLEEMLTYFNQGRQRELNVTNPKYLKQIIEALINKKYCERVQGKKNTLKYIA